jgi:SAM-dependent methyltransferase
MPSISLFSSKAALYARYRWEYVPGAVEMIFNRTGIDSRSTIIELGAGTGILTRRLAGRASRVIAVEPDMQMIRWIRPGLPTGTAVSVVGASAEAVPLPTQCADAILVAQAIHWFHPAQARQEMLRLLRNPGWLVLLRNYGTEKRLGEAMEAINLPENGVEDHPQRAAFPRQPVDYYFGHAGYSRHTFPFSYRQDWDAFLGSLLTTSYAPDENHPLFDQYCRHARQVFEQFAPDGWLESSGETELLLGQVEA